MKKTQEILKHLFDLYEENENSKESIIRWCEKNMERYHMWEEAFAEYDMVDVFTALDNYWRFQNNKTKPTVAKILAMLNTNKEVEKEKPLDIADVKYFNIESNLMSRDLNLGRNKEYFLNDYRRAVNYILVDRLKELIGYDEYKKLSNQDKTKEITNKYNLALRNGLFNEFDDILSRVNCSGGTTQLKNVDDLVKSWRI